jgi:flagellar basal-body rod modification protein FlgD
METSAVTTQATNLSATQKFAENFNNFLTLLTTQLKNQDPSKPMDPSEFTTQLVQFTNVEQQIAMNAKLAELIALQEVNQTLAAAGYLGSTVEVNGSTMPLKGGSASFTYTLAQAAEAATINIFDSSGKLVRRAEAETGIGRHEFTWDGKDDGGNTLSDGAYSVTVSARAGETPITATVHAIGEVTGISRQGGQVLLSLSGVPITLDQMIEVRKTAAPASN